MQQFSCETTAWGDRHLPINVDNHDYQVELGYLDSGDHWHTISRSASVRVPACPTPALQTTSGVGATATAAAVAGGALAGAGLGQKRSIQATADPGRIILVPRSAESAYTYWELSDEQKRGLGDQQLTLRIADVSDDPTVEGHQVVHQYDYPETLQDMHIEIPVDNRDYVAELGYTTADGTWHRLVRSQAVHIPAKAAGNSVVRPADILSNNSVTVRADGTLQNGNLLDALCDRSAELSSIVARAAGDFTEDGSRAAGAAVAGGAALTSGGAAAARSFLDSARARLASDPGVGAGIRSELGAQSQIILVPRNAESAYAYWEADEVHKRALRQQGGQQMKLRIHDATNLNIDYQSAHSTHEYALSETDQDKHVTIPTPDRDYVAELGYLTADGQWLRLLRSLHVRVPAAN